MENKSSILRPIGSAHEWRAHWTLALASLIGYSAIGLQTHGLGPFVPHLERAFGWNRSEVMIGVSVSNGLGILLNVIIGMIVDRYGSRPVALTGLIVMTGSFALLGTASGGLVNWAALWCLVAIGVVLVQSTVWTRALARCFDQARGLAFAVALSGAPLAAMILPPLATLMIGQFGWRGAFLGVGAIWLAVSMGLVFLFFREPHKRVEAGPKQIDEPAAGKTFREGVRTKAFVCLLVSFASFSFYAIAMGTNLVPLLSETGLSVGQAAGIAAIMGIVGMIARLSVGFLLDRFPGHLIGTATMLLPVIGCAILIMDAPGALLIAVAVALFGAAIGAEMDVALYLASRHFGLRAFAALFGAIITSGAAAGTIAPYLAGAMHDRFGTYDALLVVFMVVMGIGALAMALLGRPPTAYEAERATAG